VSFLPWYEHIPLHRLWVIARVGHTPALIEQEHLRKCDRCYDAFLVCATAKNFGAALKILNGEDDPQSQAG